MPTEERINLLYVVTKLELGGAQGHVFDLIDGLDREKFAPFLFSAADGYFVGRARSTKGLFFHGSGFLERAVNPWMDLCALVELAGFIIKNRIRVVHTHSSKAGILGRLAAGLVRVPGIIHTVHGWSFHEYQPGFLRCACMLMERLLARWTDVLVVVSRGDEQKGLKAGIVPRGAYALIRCGFSVQDFMRQEREASRRVFGLSEGDTVVGMVACLKPQKAPLDFVRLAGALKAQMPRVKFLWAGDGILREEIMRLIRAKGLEKDFILTGWREDIPWVLSAMDVFVLTSLWEGLPISVYEAMASRVPVVVTDTVGVRDVVVDGQTGFLVRCGDVADMCAKVLRVAGDPALRERAVAAARARVMEEEFSLTFMMGRMGAVYRKTLEKGWHV